MGHEIEAHDEDRARDAVEKGEILPLKRVVARLKRAVQGEISGVELEREGPRWMYEFKVIAQSGRMVEVRIDAKRLAMPSTAKRPARGGPGYSRSDPDRARQLERAGRRH
jgi:uncharacterized membrane protein YkoI